MKDERRDDALLEKQLPRARIRRRIVRESNPRWTEEKTTRCCRITPRDGVSDDVLSDKATPEGQTRDDALLDRK